MKNVDRNRQGNWEMEKIATDQCHNLKEKLNAIDEQILVAFPITSYCERIQLLPRVSGYYSISQDIKDNIERIQLKYGQYATSLYHRLALSFFIQKSSVVLQENKIFTQDIISSYNRHFDWVLQNLISQEYEDINYYDYDNDLFLKDLGICSLRVFPIGAQVIELLGISRRFILYHGFNQFFQASYFYLKRMKGNSPFYHVHLDVRWIKDFNKAGWCRCFQSIAEMLKRNPDVKGVFGSSWFYDPHLEQISPGLLYLRKIPELGGAKIFKWGSSVMDIENATLKSERRKKLYEEGKYVPTSYVFIWSRDDLIKWAENSAESSVMHNSKM